MAFAEKKKKGLTQMARMNLMRGDIPAEVVRGGVTMPWMVSEKAVQTLKEYEVRGDDVWITTYPKSGTHWAVEVVSLVLADGEEEKIDRKKQPSPIEFDLSQPGVSLPPEFPAHKRDPLFERCKSWPSPRVFMTHLPEHLMPQQIYEGKGKVIFVIRNPKDLAVSMWHFLRPARRIPTTTNGIPSWIFTAQTIDLRGAVVQVADFIGRPLSDEAIERVVKSSTVDSMKQRFYTVDDTSGKPKIGAPGTIRKGIVGDWKTQFTVAQNETFDRIFRKKMEGSDLHIDFEVKKYF